MAGAATTKISPRGEAGIIEVAKVGEGAVSLACFDDDFWCRWGDYTGMSVVHGEHVWYSASTAVVVNGSNPWYGTWIGSKPLHGYY